MVELARGHVETGAAVAAEVYYRMILKDTGPPKSGIERVARGEACMWFARKALYEGRGGTAIDWYMMATQADPLAVDYRVEYIVKGLLPCGMYKTARIEAERCTRIDPTDKNGWRTLGGVEQILGNAEASIAAYDKQLEIAPDDPNAMLDRATIALDTADYAKVRALCYPILQTSPERCGDAMHALAMADYREGFHEAAIKTYQAAIDNKCHDPDLARWNMSLAQHSIGDYLEGWKNHEARGTQKTDPAMALVMNRFQKPRWQGEQGPARIHLHQEMGHGDTIAMVRYIPLLIDKGLDVTVEVNDSLVELLKRSFPQVKVMPKAVDYPGALGIPDFDYHLPMLSLPAVFNTAVSTVPWLGPYLKPDPELVRKYDEILGDNRTGLCWSSGIRTEGLWLPQYGRRKSMHFSDVYQKLGKYCEFVSLQVGPERLDHGNAILDILPPKPAWDDTAALIACLDLVVTVDTSVAHLAGALGKLVYLMMHTEGSWHWMSPRGGAPWNERSPWYPGAEIFRQDKPFEWDGVLKQLRERLE